MLISPKTFPDRSGWFREALGVLERPQEPSKSQVRCSGSKICDASQMTTHFFRFHDFCRRIFGFPDFSAIPEFLEKSLRNIRNFHFAINPFMILGRFDQLFSKNILKSQKVQWFSNGSHFICF